MDKLIFNSYDKKFNNELNSWHSKEHLLNSNGLTQFIVPEDVLLGDYLSYVEEEMDGIDNFLIFADQQLIGFLGFSTHNNNHIHIEYVGVNPSCRGKGYAKEILLNFKEEILSRIPDAHITLSVNTKNTPGIKSFLKIAKKSNNQRTSSYIELEL